MKTSDCDILIVPGHLNASDDHWQSRWERQLSTARRIEQEDWESPRKDDWVARIVEEVARAEKPVVLVGHSLGVIAIAFAAPLLPKDKVKGAFLVGMPDVDRPDFEPVVDRAFAPIPQDPLPFPSVLVASRTDPHCEFDKAEDVSYAWGSALVDAGDAGHLNTDSGHGPWPEGLMRFAGFLKQLT
ncbi:RBBP9/YdeN family alpha/beta hydrolase [Microvirga antarctica]|uniref:RBBP9/YdeN family alpha/beta hydrolase n=1 Tax=Microvirga antarctica TaxID=2819233 RepID=UPI001B3140F6|nr:alpha/beta hydrolase [Microvirga antarctica]